MTFKPCKLTFQDQDWRMDSQGRIYWLCNQGPQEVTDSTLIVTVRAEIARRRQRNARRARDEAYRSCGLVKVRGALGGVYWE